MKLLYVVLLSISACAPAGGSTVADSGSSGAEGFLTASDIVPPSSLSSLSAAALQTKLPTMDALYNNNPKVSANCISEAINDQTITGSDTKLLLNSTVDLGSCLSSLFSTPAVTFTFTAELKFFYSLTCSGGGLNKYVGQAFSKVSLLTVGTVCPSSSSLLGESSLKSSGTYTGHNAAGAAISGKASETLVIYQGQGDFSPCEWSMRNGLNTAKADCQYTNIVSFAYQSSNGPSLPVPASSTYELVTSHAGETFLPNATSAWPVSGQPSVTVNNWQGTVTYNGASAAPTYSFTSSAGTVTGQIKSE